MAAFYQAFTAARTTEPDYDSLLSTLRSADATIGLRRDDTTLWTLKKSTLWTAPQIAAAQNVLNTVAARTDESLAQAEVDKLGIRERAILLTLLDQLNLLRLQPITVMASVTPAQAIAAVRTKAGTL